MFFKTRSQFTAQWIERLVQRMEDVFNMDYADDLAEQPTAHTAARVRRTAHAFID